MAHEKDLVKDAPNIDPDGELSTEEERRLYEHYGRGDYDDWGPDSEDRTEAGFGRDAPDAISLRTATTASMTARLRRTRARRVATRTTGR